eukprot:TRINITY_DN31645_c0_g1_i1.p1 TRINITY_DN31645_c0_g1~~TRINITY_DN31645_c0_g1_i1.p1  ORF type:complete len:244 (+),score=33.65 TRINITY_DN31645_c0_g1_i1:73-804(+)
MPVLFGADCPDAALLSLSSGTGIRASRVGIATCFAQEPGGGAAGGNKAGHRSSPESSADPQVPRKLAAQYKLRQRGAWPVPNFGLRSIGNRLYVCDSDDDAQLIKEGHCGLASTKWSFGGHTAHPPHSGSYILPVRWWDDVHGNWSGEQAPYATVPEWMLKVHDGRLHIETIREVPHEMTTPTPGQLPDPIEMTMPGPDVAVALQAPSAQGTAAVSEDSGPCGQRARKALIPCRYSERLQGFL